MECFWGDDLPGYLGSEGARELKLKLNGWADDVLPSFRLVSLGLRAVGCLNNRVAIDMICFATQIFVVLHARDRW